MKIHHQQTADLRSADPSTLSARDKILRTAIILFNAHGVHTTGIDKIIADSDVAKMTFYKHFPSKNDLINAYLDYRDKVQFERLERHTVKKTSDPRLQILGIFDALDEWFSEPDYRGCAFTRGLADFGDSPESEAFKSVQRHFAKWQEFVATPLKAIMPMKRMRFALPQLMSLIIGSIVMENASSHSGIAKVNKKLAAEVLGSD
jgi:AcrR family transcriptional regulator